ncbi:MULTISPECIES: hypothetical protein [unclassified Enterococcus]|uniref:hypothetical protein n=1 Tax=unclassified Enterococcus TaxID=2608891 RepID=UPI0013EDBC17|nr:MULTISPECIES: hypothetical protein [unclassified Enterococcus]
MEGLLIELTQILQGIDTEIFFEMNKRKNIIYPYGTFNLDSEPIRRNQDGFYLDIDLFDRDDSFLNLLNLEEKLKTALDYQRILTPALNLSFRFEGSAKVPTGDEQLKRRNVRFYIAVDWRLINYGID